MTQPESAGRRRWLDYYLRILRQEPPDPSLLSREQSQIRHVWLYVRHELPPEERRDELIQELVLAASDYHAAFSLWTERLEWVTAGQEAARRRGDHESALLMLAEAARCHAFLGRTAEARRILETALPKRARSRRVKLLRAAMLELLADLAEQDGQLDLALRHLRCAWRGVRKLDDASAQARLLLSRAKLHVQYGRARVASKLVARAHMASSRVPDLDLRADLLRDLGEVTQRLGRWRLAWDCYNEAFDLIKKGGDPLKAAVVLFSLAGLLQEGGQPRAAMALYEGIRPIFAHTPRGRPTR